MKTLHIISTLNPAYGGPVEGLRQMSASILALGHGSEIVTLDSPSKPWSANAPVKVHALGPSYLGVYSFAPRLLPWLKQNARHYDAIIVHGIWQYHSLATWLSGIPYHIFVHGALDPWFRRAYPLKHLKKWPYWLPVEYHVLKNARSVLFTSEEEKILARQSFEIYRANEKVIGYGIAAPPPEAETQRAAFLAAFPELKSRKILLYLGRIDRKKGCDLLIQAFSRLSSQNPEWTLVMAGPDATNLRAELEQLTEVKNIIWPGMLTGQVKWGALRAASVFALPSHSENFGIAVVESLACGIPVLISDKINIWREIKQAGAGLVATDTLAGTTNMLQRWFDLGTQGQSQIAKNARPCFEQFFDINQTTQDLIQHLQNSQNEH